MLDCFVAIAPRNDADARKKAANFPSPLWGGVGVGSGSIASRRGLHPPRDPTHAACGVGPPHKGEGLFHINAWMPVWARPRIRAWMSWVPS
jgi:hypothetical protein